MAFTIPETFDMHRITRLACCGKAAVAMVLDQAGLPPMGAGNIRADGPTGLTCDEITVMHRLTDYAEAPSPVSGRFGAGCVIVTRETFEVTVGRNISNWFGEPECRIPEGTCETVLDCDLEWVAPTSCNEPGRTQTDEHALVYADRTALTAYLARAWIACLCDPDGAGCGGCADPRTLNCTTATLTLVEPYGEGGCAGTVFTIVLE